MSIYYKFNKAANDIPVDRLEETAKDLLKKWSDHKSTAWSNHFSFGIDHVTRSGCYLVAGYSFSLKSILKKYMVKNQFGIHEYYAPNKTALRTSGYAKSHDKIMEVPANW
jgi:hypothetical protein